MFSLCFRSPSNVVMLTFWLLVAPAVPELDQCSFVVTADAAKYMPAMSAVMLLERKKCNGNKISMNL